MSKQPDSPFPVLIEQDLDVIRDPRSGLPVLVDIARPGEPAQRFGLTPDAARALARKLIAAADEHDTDLSGGAS